MVMLMRLEAER